MAVTGAARRLASVVRVQARPRPPSAPASVLAAAGIVLALAGCTGHITPLGPDGPPPAPTLAPSRHLGSPIILQVMRSQPPTATGGCPAGWRAVSRPRGSAPMPCYRPVGTPVTITSAGVSPVSASRPTAPPGQPAQPTQYGFTVAVPAADVAAMTAVMTQAADSGGAVGISVAGKLWEAPQVVKPFQLPGRLLQIALLSKNQAVQLYRLLVPPS